jgi:hypothetical protein
MGICPQAIAFIGLSIRLDLINQQKFPKQKLYGKKPWYVGLDQKGQVNGVFLTNGC